MALSWLLPNVTSVAATFTLFTTELTVVAMRLSEAIIRPISSVWLTEICDVKSPSDMALANSRPASIGLLMIRETLNASRPPISAARHKLMIVTFLEFSADAFTSVSSWTNRSVSFFRYATTDSRISLA